MSHHRPLGSWIYTKTFRWVTFHRWWKPWSWGRGGAWVEVWGWSRLPEYPHERVCAEKWDGPIPVQLLLPKEVA